jgi:hypothetical protein
MYAHDNDGLETGLKSSRGNNLKSVGSRRATPSKSIEYGLRWGVISPIKTL